MTKVPCRVYHVRKDGTTKVLTANTTEELESLLRIGWQLEESQ